MVGKRPDAAMMAHYAVLTPSEDDEVRAIVDLMKVAARDEQVRITHELRKVVQRL